MLDALKKRIARLEGDSSVGRHLTHEEWVDRLQAEDRAEVRAVQEHNLVAKHGSLEAVERAARAAAERVGDPYYRQLDELAREPIVDAGRICH